MKRAKGHCDDRGPRTLGCQGSWNIVMKEVMEHCDDRDYRALW